ncbi:MAG: zinc-dependent metalloprotease family protein, partial [Candidatus Thermoplasmatota archaeon]|nr:zinc-dependent metalloprotease family protein [Candidatus Thermoplasmatota archaeon]
RLPEGPATFKMDGWAWAFYNNFPPGTEINDLYFIYVRLETHLDPTNRDTDGDGIPDGEELHTYGTSPLNPDTDYDGLNDYFETNQFGTNGRIGWGDVGIPVSAKPDPFKQDIYVEVDWMGPNENDVFNPSHFGVNFTPVEKRFASAGIRLHIDSGLGDWEGFGGDDVEHSEYLYISTNGDASYYENNYDFWEVKNKYFKPERRNIFHYCLFADTTDAGNVGGYAFPQVVYYSREYAEKLGYDPGVSVAVHVGDDFVISVTNVVRGTGNDDLRLIAVFMHELGHNLGLRHHYTSASYSLSAMNLGQFFDRWSQEYKDFGAPDYDDFEWKVVSEALRYISQATDPVIMEV